MRKKNAEAKANKNREFMEEKRRQEAANDEKRRAEALIIKAKREEELKKHREAVRLQEEALAAE
jgi:hypothetical protein